MEESVKKRHPSSVDSAGMSNFELGRAIIGMRYDCTAEVVEGMLCAMRDEMEADRRRGYVKLVRLQEKALVLIFALSRSLQSIFVLCKPFMRDELEH